MRLTERLALPVKWEREFYGGAATGSVNLSDDGTVDTVTNPIAGHWPIPFTGDWGFEFTIGAEVIPEKIGMEDISVNPFNDGRRFYFSAVSSTQVRCEGISTTQFTVAPGDRLRIERRGPFVDYYLNKADALSAPVYRSAHSPEGFVFKPFFQEQVSAGYAGKCRILLPMTSCLYTAAMQTADFGSVQSAIKVRVFQESSIVGAGDYAEETL
jgi:hypothetical protein